MRRLRTTLVAVFGLLAMAVPAYADCGKTIIDDYFADGSVDGHYSQACYQRAIAEFPQDAVGYSNGLDAIQAAQARDKLGTTTQPSGDSNPARTTDNGTQTAPQTTTAKPRRTQRLKPKPTTTAGATTTGAAVPPPGTTDGGNGPVGEAISAIGPKHADQVPVPVIVLGVFAILLIGAGGGGLFLQRRQRPR